jgi:hypothetical protein
MFRDAIHSAAAPAYRRKVDQKLQSAPALDQIDRRLGQRRSADYPLEID